jgi:hypothetical protein
LAQHIIYPLIAPPQQAGQISKQRGVRGGADVKARPGTAEIALFLPPAIAFHLVCRIESVALDQTGGQAKGHRSVIRPLARREPERPAARHIGDRFEGAPPLKLDRRANGITGRKPQEAAAITVTQSDVVNQIDLL